MPPLNLYARVRFRYLNLHARPRVQRAPGLPCALCFSGGATKHNSGALRVAGIFLLSENGIENFTHVVPDKRSAIRDPQPRMFMLHDPEATALFTMAIGGYGSPLSRDDGRLRYYRGSDEEKPKNHYTVKEVVDVRAEDHVGQHERD